MLWKELRNLHQKKINNLWIQVLVDLSNRNVEFTNKYLIDLLEWISDSDNSLLEVIKNAVCNLCEFSEDFMNKLDEMIIEETHQAKVFEILVQATKNGAHLKKETISQLLKLSQSNPKDRAHIFEIFMNLSKNNCKLPKAAAQLGEFISHIDVIKSNDKSCSNKNEAVLKIIEIDRKNDLSHFVTYESLLMHLENLIKDHKNSQLSLTWMDSIYYFWQKNPNLLTSLNWNLISTCVKYPEFDKKLFELFEIAAENQVKFSPGALAKLADSSNKGIYLLDY